VQLATRTSLVILKAVAFANRFEPRDLVDIARLVLQDAVSGGTLERDLRSELAQADPATRESIRVVRARFDSPDLSGPRAFAMALRATVVGLTDWDDREDGVCQRVSVMVRALLPEF
jgi:hypothetical protein